jgi:hypothetical protein
MELDRAIARLESAGHRRGLAETLLRVGSEAFSPSVAWRRFASVVSNCSVDVSA